MSDIKILEQRALEIRAKYNQLEKDRGKEPWDALKQIGRASCRERV